MQTELFRYDASTGWEPALDPTLDSPHTLVLLFSGQRDDEISQPLAEVKSTFPQALLMGVSTAGEIMDAEFVEEGAVLSVTRFEQTPLRLDGHVLKDAGDSYATGQELAGSLDAPDLKAVFVLSEGLNVNGSSLIDGFNEVLGDRVVITGGLAGDGARFEKTWVLCGGEPQSNTVCALGLYGDHIRVAHGSKGGWDMLGPEREVTCSEGNVLFELDSQPALEVYKKYLGERAQGLPATGLLFPLALREDDADEETKVRTILAVDEAHQSITFAGDIPEGGLVRLMHANFDRLIDGAASAAESTDLSSYQEGLPLLNIAISCVGRHLVLGQRTEEEIESVLDCLPDGTRQVGYYSYGELSPLANGRCDLHNQTMTLTLLWEG